LEEFAAQGYYFAGDGAEYDADGDICRAHHSVQARARRDRAAEEPLGQIIRHLLRDVAENRPVGNTGTPAATTAMRSITESLRSTRES
jgi:hypothetical protein